MHNENLQEKKKEKIESSLTISQTSPGFNVSTGQVFENTVGKGEIARDEQFLLSPQCFPPIWRTFKFEIVICKLFQFGRV